MNRLGIGAKKAGECFGRNVKDIITAAVVAVVCFVLAYISLRLWEADWMVPWSYYGGDEMSPLVFIKSMQDFGWYAENPGLGAPFGAEFYDYPAFFLSNFDHVIMKVLSLVLPYPTVINAYYVFLFPMMGLIAYIAARVIKISPVIASFGAITFAFLPAIFFRGVSHFYISMYQFVPLTILLCIWLFSDPSLLQLEKEFFRKKKNWVVIFLLFLISNNGTGYYSFFTCFFLCVVFLINVLNYALANKEIKILANRVGEVFEKEKQLTNKKKNIHRKSKNVLVENGDANESLPSFVQCFNSLVAIGFIFIFSIISLLPSIIYWIQNGLNSSAVVRSMGDIERYALLFYKLVIPFYDRSSNIVKQFPYLSGLYDTVQQGGSNYAFIGVIGTLGLFALILKLFGSHSIYKKDEDALGLLSKLNIAAILLATLGGFSTIVGFITTVIRCYERISVFIAWICILAFCILLQRMWDRCVKLSAKSVFYSTLAVLFCVNLVIQLPYTRFDFNKSKMLFLEDQAFVSKIEESVDEHAMIYQMPYHGYPENGPVKEMKDYAQFAGYLHSDTLQWSYGNYNGRKGDLWHRSLAKNELENVLQVLSTVGFDGICVDWRAYTPEEKSVLEEKLKKNLGKQEIITHTKEIMSFYSMKEYNASLQAQQSNEEKERQKEQCLQGKYSMSFSSQKLSYTKGEITENGELELPFGGVQFGPYIMLPPGEYEVIVKGNNLLSLEIDFGSKEVPIITYEVISLQNNEAKYHFSTIETLTNVEFRASNKQQEVVVGIQRIELNPI